MTPTPAVSTVATLDHPWRFLRKEFPRWAPAAYGLALIGMAPNLVTQWASGAMLDPTNLAKINFAALGGVYGGACLGVVAVVIAQLGAYVIAWRVLETGRCSFTEALLGALSPRMLVLGGAVLLFQLLGFGCVVGGPLVAALLGFAPVATLARPGEWFSCWGAAIDRAVRRTSPRDAGMPGWKLAALTLTWYLLLQAATQLAVIPTFAWMIWHFVSTLGQNDPAAFLQMTPPFAISMLTVLLSTALKPLGDLYLAAGVVLLWRDVVRLRTGADLEAALGA